MRGNGPVLFFLIAVLVVTSTRTVAQDDCEATLNEATQEFQAGHFYTIPAILNRCLDKFTLEQQQRANILLTQTYLLLDDPIGARNSYLQVLKANPEFVPDATTHSIDLVYLSRKFIARPVFSWLAKAGTNITPVRVIHDIDVFGDSFVKEQYKTTAGFQFGVGGDYYLNEFMSVRGELVYLHATFQQNTTNYFQGDTKTYHERQTWLAAPVSFVYSKFHGKYRPYGYVGFSPSFLIRDMASVTIVNVGLAEGGKDDKESPNMRMIDKRNRYNQSIFLGGGVKMKFGLQFLFADVRYSVGMKNVTNAGSVYSDTSLDPISTDFTSSSLPSLAYLHVDDYFRIDNFSLSVGFIQPLYKPRELKRARTKSVMRKINSRK